MQSRTNECFALKSLSKEFAPNEATWRNEADLLALLGNPMPEDDDSDSDDWGGGGSDGETAAAAAGAEGEAAGGKDRYSKHIAQLKSSWEDETHMYVMTRYCDGGPVRRRTLSCPPPRHTVSQRRAAATARSTPSTTRSMP